jgi:hypothetical protein
VATKCGVRAAALLPARSPEALAAFRDGMRKAICALSRNDPIELPKPAVVASEEKP